VRQSTRLFVEKLEDRCVPATFLVNELLDTHAVNLLTGMDATGHVSLRSAIEAANNLGGNQIIQFDANVCATPQTITLSLGVLDLNDGTGAVTVQGPAAGVTISGNHVSEVFRVEAGTTAELTGLTIRDGQITGDGGGICNAGTLTISNCVLTGNSSSARGGAISDSGPLTVTDCIISGNSSEDGGGIQSYQATLALRDCTIADNSASWRGGGMYSFGGTTKLDNCTIANNSALSGGGIEASDHDPITLTNCTVAGNKATQAGGVKVGLVSEATFINCTVAGNTAVYCGGIFNYFGDVTLDNSIVAGNTTSYPDGDFFGSVSSLSVNNLIGDGSGITGGIDNGVNGNQVGSQSAPIDPLLAPLGDYGGPTQTMALLPGSPATAAGSVAAIPADVTTDQRGQPRIVNGVVDIGAYQSAAQAPAITSASSTTFVAGRWCSFTVTTTGYPLATLSETVVLPAGLTFTDNGNGTATLQGIPAADTARQTPYGLTIQASNGVGDDASQSFALTILPASDVPVQSVGVFRAGTGVWYLDEAHASYNPATTVQIDNFGGSSDIAVTGDWLGNHQTYVGVFRPSTGTWYLSTTNTNYSPANTIQIGNFGMAGDIPVVGRWGQNPNVDYIGVFRPSTHQWFLDEIQGNYNPATTIEIDNFGTAGDTPVVGNWGNSTISDGRSYVGVFRPGTGQWFLDEVEGNYNPATTIQINNFGCPGDVARVGDWLGGAQDGHTYVGVFRPGSGTWYLSKTNTSYAPANTLQISNFGSSGDVAQAGDWLGTSLTEVGVFRPGTGQWFLSKTNTSYTAANTIQIGNFGASGDQPVVGGWAVPEPEMLQGLPGGGTASLTEAELQTIVSAAIAHWKAAGLDSAGVALLDNLHISIGDLPSGWLGAYVSGSIVIDPTAAGDGWFVDPTDAAFAQGTSQETALPGSAAAGHVDALTVVMHEMGHALGLPDETSGVMSESLAPGTRNLPTPTDVADAFASGKL
jgi:hypothetical protein